jgi:hypothetical protein
MTSHPGILLLMKLHRPYRDGKEVPAMNEERKMLELVDITALTDEELDDIVGGGGVEPKS